MEALACWTGCSLMFVPAFYVQSSNLAVVEIRRETSFLHGLLTAWPLSLLSVIYSVASTQI